MDTRNKIITADEAAKITARGAVVASGHFDPMLASHAERLAKLERRGKPLIVSILDPQRAILPARARAELVAALRDVDYVVESGSLAADVLLEQEDAARLRSLIAHVHARQRTES